MKRLFASLLAAALGATLFVTAPPAEAVPVNNTFIAEPFLDTSLTGTTAVLRPELAGTVLVDTLQSFSFGTLGLSGTVQNRVVRETISGTLDFYWRVLVDPTSTGGGISAFRLIDFGYTNITDADWRIDGLGTEAPFVARLFNPSNHPEGAVNFLFTDPEVAPSNPGTGGSRFFFLHTGAKAFAQTATFDLLGGPSQSLSSSFSTYAPAIPEPSSALLLCLGLLGIVIVLRHQNVARPPSNCA